MDRAYALQAVRSAASDPTRVRIEGVHALKHALRFRAEVEVIVTPAPDRLAALLAELAPDVTLPVAPVTVDQGGWRALTGRRGGTAGEGGRPLGSPVVAVATRPDHEPGQVARAPGHVVVLEQPRHLGNLGATVRVAAAAGAGGVLVLGPADPWHPSVVRGAAGLQFALPVARTDELPGGLDAPLVAIDPQGTPLGETSIPPDALLLVGTERGGLSPGLRARASSSVAIPMRPGVSSLNLATAVAVVLYAEVLGRPGGGPAPGVRG